MSGHLETVAAVSAVVSAFHGGADLVKQIRKRSKRRKGEQAVKEKLLQEALETGEVQISQRYTAHYDELGARFKTGDGKALTILGIISGWFANRNRHWTSAIASYRCADAVRAYSKSPNRAAV
jgi:hypothetical protein